MTTQNIDIEHITYRIKVLKSYVTAEINCQKSTVDLEAVVN